MHVLIGWKSMVYCASKLIVLLKDILEKQLTTPSATPSAHDLQAFLVFSQNPAWVITLVNP